VLPLEQTAPGAVYGWARLGSRPGGAPPPKKIQGAPPSRRLCFCRQSPVPVNSLQRLTLSRMTSAEALQSFFVACEVVPLCVFRISFRILSPPASHRRAARAGPHNRPVPSNPPRSGAGIMNTPARWSE